MKIAPVSADLLIKLAMLAGGVLVLAYVVRKASTAASDAAGAAWDATSQAVRDGFVIVSDTVSDAADYVWYGPPTAVADYQHLLDATRSDRDLNPFTNNPNNVNPNDLIPPGYRVNQWGGLERVSGGATGSW